MKRIPRRKQKGTNSNMCELTVVNDRFLVSIHAATLTLGMFVGVFERFDSMRFVVVMRLRIFRNTLFDASSFKRTIRQFVVNTGVDYIPGDFRTDFLGIEGKLKLLSNLV